MSLRQADEITRFLAASSIRWNKSWKSGRVELRGDLPAVELADGLRLTLLSPNAGDLEFLEKYSERERQRIPPDARSGVQQGEESAAAERLRSRSQERMGKKVDIEALANARFVNDTSVVNAASIAFLAEFHDKALLIGGDARDDRLCKSVKLLAEMRGKRRLRVDAFVVPHGGSARNVSREFLELIECDRYLFSTDSTHFRHPSRETIARIITFGRAAPDSPLTLVFNYRTQWTEIWASPDLQNRYRYRAVYPETNQAGIKLHI
jgi:hypothetical protein